MWRVCKEAIPSKHNLLRRKILLEDKCEQCGVEFKMAIHALWECVTLDEIGEAVPGFEDRRQYVISNTRDLIRVVHEKKKIWNSWLW